MRDFQELQLAVHEKRRQASLENRLAEQSAMTMAVLWEAYINDLFIAYIAAAPQHYIQQVISRMKQSLFEKFGHGTKWVEFAPPDTISKVQVEKLLDPKGWNLTVTSAEKLSKTANQLLRGADAKKFSLEVNDRAFVDFLIGLRNYLGHRSKASRKILSEAIKALNPASPNAGLIGQSTSVGSYLKNGAPARVQIISDRLIAIARAMS